MICLGIESTAHTFGIGIVNDKGKILSNVSDTYKTEKGGIIPVEAAKHHHEVKGRLINLALENAGITINDVNIIAYSASPGLSPCLLEGLREAKELATKLNVPLVPVNHCIAHLEIGRLLTGAKDPVLLYCSGANTQVIGYASGKYRIFGETLDIGVGNFIDTFARYAGMGFPGGPKIAALAEKGSKLYDVPYTVKGMDVAFSGLLTNLKQKLETGYDLNDLAYSLQETAFAMLVEVAERAMAHLHKTELLLGGGVACNKRLQEMCEIMCKERGAKFFCPPNTVLVDNAAMIAWLGVLSFKSGIQVKPENADINPSERTDDVKVSWR